MKQQLYMCQCELQQLIIDGDSNDLSRIFLNVCAEEEFQVSHSK